MKVNYNQQTAESDAKNSGLVPEGTYRVRFEKSETKISNNSGNEYENMTLEVVEGPETGRKIFLIIAQSKILNTLLYNILNSIDFPNFQGDTNELIGKVAMIKLTHRTYTKNDGTEGTGTQIDPFNGWIPKSEQGSIPTIVAQDPQPAPSPVQQPAPTPAPAPATNEPADNVPF